MRPLLTRSSLRWMSCRGYWLAGTLMQQLSSVYNNQWLDTWDGTLPDAVVILRDQAEGCLLHQMNYIVAWLNDPNQSLNHSAGDVDQILGLAADYLSLDNRVSSEGRWDFGWLGLTGTGLGKPWHLPPLKGTTSWHAMTCGPSWGYHVWGIGEVWYGAKGEISEIKSRYVLQCLWVPEVKLGYQPSWAFDIFCWSPFIFYNPISLPMYQEFQFASEYSAVQNPLYFVFLNSIMNYSFSLTQIQYQIRVLHSEYYVS